MRKMLLLIVALFLFAATLSLSPSNALGGEGKYRIAKECKVCRKQFKEDKRKCKALGEDKEARRSCMQNTRARAEQCVQEHCPGN